MANYTSYFFLAVWLSLLAVVASLPSPEAAVTLRGVEDTISVPVSHNIGRKRNFHLEYYKTLSKYNVAVPARLQKIVSKIMNEGPGDEETSVPAISVENDLEWIAPASIGTPPQQMMLDFDTGSADTWMFSADTKASQVKGQTLYDSAKSSTAKLVPNATWSIIYGDFSSCSGIVYKDTFTLGNVAIPNMTIEAAKSVSAALSKQQQMSGLVGLSFSSIIQTSPAMPALIDFLPSVLRRPLFTSDLRHNSTKGSYNFGFIDRSLHDSEIKYIDIDDSKGFWGVQFTGFAVAGSDVQWEFDVPPTVIIDTGSTLFYAPEEAVTEYFKAVPGSVYSKQEYAWLLPCNCTAPDFVWELGDAKGSRILGSVPSAFFIYEPLIDGSGMCYSGLQQLSGFTGLEGILGDVFLKAGFQVFDIGQKRFGSATKALDADIKAASVGNFRQKKSIVIK